MDYRLLLEVSRRSLAVSGLATLISLALGLPLALALAAGRWPGRRVVAALVNAGMGLPPTVVGLTVAFLLFRGGPLGFLGLLYTNPAMVIAQVVIATPVVAGVSMAAFQQLPRTVWMELAALAPPWHLRALLLAREALAGLLAATIAGFGAVISEVGASLMVGGNIHGQTQVLTTATVEAVRKGEFGVALGFSAVLLGLIFVVAALLTLLQQRNRR